MYAHVISYRVVQNSPDLGLPFILVPMLLGILFGGTSMRGKGQKLGEIEAETGSSSSREK
jgi:hypothetical protein